MKNPKLAQLRKLLLKMPVRQRWAIIRRAKFELIRGGRYDEAKPPADAR
jgi:hypothetical protein